MKMLGQDNPRVNHKREAVSDLANNLTEQGDMPQQQIVAVALVEIDGEKIGAAWLPGAVIVGHGRKVPVRDAWCNILRLLLLIRWWIGGGLGVIDTGLRWMNGAMPFGYCTLRNWRPGLSGRCWRPG